MNLSDLLIYDNIVIQCHDNPDSDAIASGFGLYKFFKLKNRNVSFIYSGRSEICKKDLLMLVNELKIPITFVQSSEKLPEGTQLLLMTDCQYGQKNVSRFDAPRIVDIDHHQENPGIPDGSDVRSNIGSCSTIVWEHLKKEAPELLSDRGLEEALYYGLYIDTSMLTEIPHPLDKDMRDSIEHVSGSPLLRRLKNSNMTLTELNVAGRSLLSYEYHPEHRYAIFQAEPCDPNLLGMISDLTLSVECIDVCLVYSILGQGIKYSIRSCEMECPADEVAAYLAEGTGAGGGHKYKAGGWIDLSKASPDGNREKAENMLKTRLAAYFTDYDVIYAGRYHADVSLMQKYEKLPARVGYVRSSDIAPEGAKMIVRMLEGEFEVTSDKNTFIMLGIAGELYPISRDKFEYAYRMTDEDYVPDMEIASDLKEYEPTVRDSLSGEIKTIRNYVHGCMSDDNSKIYAEELKKKTKVFTRWDEDTFMLGNPGDILAVRAEDLNDVYIIRRKIFDKSYRKV